MATPHVMPPARAGLFRRTPPAIFPPILGLFGLGLCWRRAGEVYGMPAGIGEAILGAVTLLYLFSLMAYLAKLARRPAVLVDELHVLPGRAGLATMTQGGMLVAAALVPFAPGTAAAVLIAAVAGHALIAALSAWVIATGPAEQRHVTPVWHLTFVGFIVAPVAALPLGMVTLSQVATVFAAAMAGLVYAFSFVQLARRDPPPPLRPLLAIHLAPMGLFGIAAAGFGKPGIALVFGVLGVLVLAALLARARYIAEAGFSPFWGAFTFPFAAFTNLMLILAGSEGPAAGAFRVLAGLALTAGTLAIPVIAFRIHRLWARGVLAAKTNATTV